MTDSRKSSRSRKAVNYSSFEADDSDDDFAGSNPPPSKRTKLDKKERSAKDDRSKDKTSTKKRQEKERTRPVTLTEGQNDSTAVTRTRNDRVSLDDKVFDREMQLALELSMQESQTDEHSEDRQTSGRKRNTQAQIHTMELALESSSAEKSSVKIFETDNKENLALAKKPSKAPPSVFEHSDEIVLVETVHEDEVEGGGRRKRRAAAREAVARQREMAGEESDKGEEEQEFQADSDGDSSSDEYDAGDSDYEEFATLKKKRKPGGNINKGKSPKSAERSKKSEAWGRARKVSVDKKTKATPKTAQKKSPASKPTTPVTPLVRRPQVGGPRRGFTPPAITGDVKTNSQDTSLKLTPPVIRKNVWTSPSSSAESNPLGGVKLVSPGQTIRLGLSRNVRLKPLHSSTKVL